MAAVDWRSRPLWAVTACYVAARLLVIVRVDPAIHPDSASYQVPPSFMGHHTRTWVVPLVQYILTDRQVVIAQSLLSALAFVVLAIALATTLNNPRARTFLMMAVLALGIAPRVTYWDAMMLSESIAISLTALLIAALVWIERLPAAAFVAIFTLWLFTRDGHLYLGVLVLVGLAWWGWRHRQAAVPVGVAAALLWGFVAAANNPTIEGYNVAANVAYRVTPDRGRFLWFFDEGMPESDAFEIPQPFIRQIKLSHDPEFWRWSTTDGPGIYLRFLLTHPGFTLGALNHIFVGGGIVGESLVDHTKSRMLETPGPSFVWPEKASRYSFVLVWIAGLGACLVAWARRLDRRWLLPSVLVGSTIPHALLAYHASPFDIARHGVILSLVLVVSGWWLIALGVDTFVSPPPGVRSRPLPNEVAEPELVDSLAVTC